MNDTHRYFVQFMLKNGSVSFDEALSFCKKIDSDFDSTTQLKDLIAEINRNISKQSFKISVTTCEVTDEEVVIWLNTKNDNFSKLHLGFSPIELEYFNTIMLEIIASEERKLTSTRCINLASTLTATFSRESGQNVLNDWVNGGYFVRVGEHVYLGPRLIMEFTAYLRSHCANCVCGLCSEMAFTGKICASCDKIFHSSCLKKYLQNHDSCPICKNRWEGVDIFQGTQSQSMEDINQPGPSHKY